MTKNQRIIHDLCLHANQLALVLSEAPSTGIRDELFDCYWAGRELEIEHYACLVRVASLLPGRNTDDNSGQHTRHSTR